MEQHVSQFFPEMHWILLVNCLAGLVDLLQKIPANAFVGLDAVPGTAVRRTEHPNQLTEIFKIIARFAIKIYHTFPFFASADGIFCRNFFCNLPPYFGGFVRLCSVLRRIGGNVQNPCNQLGFG